ncbi:hypothetical protein BKI52_23685 [marine bacterium AO1-C]|nr:hypothetical protein BKI52_23685 [marine bacterium AO1-C]
MNNLRFTLLAIFGLIGQISFAQTTNYGNGSGTGGTNSAYFGVNTGRVSTGMSNTFIGASSGFNNTTGNYNTFLGQATGYINTTGSNNTYVGHWSGNRNTTGSNNAAFGYRTARFNTTGYANTFMGYMSGYKNTTGYQNTFMGFQSGHNNTTGYHNTTMGYQSGYNMTSARYNTLLGYQAGYTTTTSLYNTMVGYQAGYSATTGGYNVMVGQGAGRATTTGGFNVYLGRQAGFKGTTARLNVSVGYLAGYNNESGASNVFIGPYAGYNETGSNKLYIENSTNLTTPLIYGDFSANGVGINTNQLSDGSTDYTLSVNGKVRATEVKVYTGWADYVFEEGYQLRSLEEVEAHINQNGHLPDVPSAKVVEKNGIFVGEMNATLLRKIEELTLYMIESNKATKALQKEVANLKKENKVLKAKLQK